MKERKPKQNPLFTGWILILCAVGFLLNLGLSNLVLYFKLPLFLDNVGSILVAVLGGALPGMFVGFATNVINGISDPITMYYGILSVLIAQFATYFSTKGYFKKVTGCIVAIFCFSLIGGALGSCMTWMLYGGGIGEGISAPYAIFLNNHGFSVFWAQFFADMLIDIPDKALSVLPVAIFLKLYPSKLYNKFPLSYMYDRNEKERKDYYTKRRSMYRKSSVHNKIIGLILTASVMVGVASTVISVMNYKEKLSEQYGRSVSNTARIAADMIDGDNVNAYIQKGEAADGYLDIQKNLERIYKNIDGLAYLYVYQIKEDGCHVVFDVDTKTVKGDNPGDIVAFDKSFIKYKDKLIKGEEMPPIITNDSYGWLISSYIPIKDSNKKTVAYACADTSMEQYVSDMLIYIIKIIAVLFGVLILITAIALWFAEHYIVEPINSIVEQYRAFDKTSPEQWLQSDEWKNRKMVDTGDEIEELFKVVCDVESNVAKNVTELKATQIKLQESEEIKKKNEELAIALSRADEANAAKTIFLSNVSHDMRTPLNSVIGFTELAKDTEDFKEREEYLNKIEYSAKYLLGLINDTLDLSRMETGKVKLIPQITSGKLLLQTVIECNKPAADKKNITINVDMQQIHFEAIYVDPLRIQEIFNNIIANAIKFTGEGGTIHMMGECLGIENEVIHDKFIISDNGIGMSEEFLPHVFEPFFQENPYENGNYTGTGLGLSIVKQLVELMGGSIEVESKLGKGTTFTVYLDVPLAKGQILEQENKNEKTVDLTAKQVLLCDDHPLNVELAKRLLERRGMKVTTANNGKEAVEIVKASEEGYFDVILMDIRMPIMDGIEATKQIRQLAKADAKTIPIIAMTANAYDEDRENTMNAGMCAHLAKPIEADLLYRTISEYIK